MSALGSQLRDARLEAGWSLVDLAVQMAATASFLSQVERGQRPVPPYVLGTYEDVLGTTFKREPERTAPRHRPRYDLNLWIGHPLEGATYLPR